MLQAAYDATESASRPTEMPFASDSAGGPLAIHRHWGFGLGLSLFS